MLSSRLNQSPPAAAPRAAPAVQAARPQPPILSVRCGASRRPAGGILRWPAAGAGRAGRPQARASAGRMAAGWHGVGGRGRWKRPFDFPIPPIPRSGDVVRAYLGAVSHHGRETLSGVWRCNFLSYSAQCLACNCLSLCNGCVFYHNAPVIADRESLYAPRSCP
jgi:hypothetical protein